MCNYFKDFFLLKSLRVHSSESEASCWRMKYKTVVYGMVQQTLVTAEYSVTFQTGFTLLVIMIINIYE